MVKAGWKGECETSRTKVTDPKGEERQRNGGVGVCKRQNGCLAGKGTRREGVGLGDVCLPGLVLSLDDQLADLGDRNRLDACDGLDDDLIGEESEK